MTKKHIYIYSPSGAVRDKAAFRRGVARLKTLGHEVEIDIDALTSHQRFAGDDATRLAAIHRAAASDCDVAMISRGGYGLTRILDGINYKAVAKSIDKGTQFVGFSDFTAFSLAVLAKTGKVTWAGPALCDDFGAGSPAGEPDAHGAAAEPTGSDDIREDCFNDMITGQGEGAGWRLGKESGQSTTPASIHIKNATLWGGNLATLSGLVGTPYLPAVKGGILFLEDVAEHPYRVERLLTQLLLSGVLAQQKAIVLGQFTLYKLGKHDKGFKLQSVVDWLRSRLKIPVLTNLPFGHVATKVLLPVGAKVNLVVQQRDAFILWGHQH
jgi:muramoyltetrapeptide carboxypeptidase